MKKRLLILIMLLIALPMVFFSGCSKETEELVTTTINEVSKAVDEQSQKQSSSNKEEAPPEEEEPEETEPEETGSDEEVLDEDGWYYDPYEVAEYIHTYEHLPSNYITKEEAEDLGWNGKGNLWQVAEGMCIGGDYFGNYEKRLPKGRYTECDVNYNGGMRGLERIIFSDDFEIYYTQDHYETFTQLY